MDDRVQAGFERQLLTWRAAQDAGAQRAGWKIGFNIAQIQEALGISEPVVGHFTSRNVLPSGSTYAIGDGTHVRVELELAVEVGRGGTIAAVAPALEVVDMSLRPDGVEEIVAGNIFHRAVVFGDFQPAPAPEPLASQLAIGTNVLPGGQPQVEEMVALVARHLDAVGEALEPGDRIITGALAHEQVQPGDEIVGRIDGLGEIRVLVG